MLRYERERDKSERILDLTSLTVEEFEELVEPFEQAFVRHMSEWTMEGKRRLSRSYTPYVNSPLPTAQDRLLFVLSYLKTASLQVVQAALFDMTQSNANKWIHILLVVLQQTLRNLKDAPTRHLEALSERLAELYPADKRAAQPTAAQPTAAQPTNQTPAPLFTTTEPREQSFGLRTAMSRKRIIAARKSVQP